MSDRKREVKGMFEGPLLPLVIRMSFPIFVGMAVQFVYNITDAFFISLIDKSDPSLMGGIGLVFPLIFLAIAFGNGLMTGVSSLVARAVGERNQDVLDKTADTALAVGVVMAVIMITVYYIFSPQMVGLLKGEGDYAVHALEYIRYIIPGVLVMLIGNVLYGILQGEGLVKYVMAGMLIGTLCNIVLDPVFIFVFKMDIKGAAIATVLAQAISMIYVLILFIMRKSIVPIHWKFRNIRLPVIGEIFSIGSSMTLNQGVMAFSFLFFNRIIMDVDPMGMTSFAICGRFDQLVLIPSLAVSSAVVAIIGQNGGRGLIDRAKKAWLIGLAVGMTAVAVFAGLIVLFAPFIFRIFSEVPEVVSYCVTQTRILEFTFLFAVVGIVGQSVFQSIGHPGPAIILTLLRLFLLAFPFVLVFVYVLDLKMYGVWFGIGLANSLTAFFGFPWCYNTFKRLKDGRLKVLKTARR